MRIFTNDLTASARESADLYKLRWTIETVWDYLRQNKLCALVRDTYEDIVEACRQAWLFLISDPERIRSIGSRKWASVNV